MKTYIYPETQIIRLLSDNVLETTSQLNGNVDNDKDLGNIEIP